VEDDDDVMLRGRGDEEGELKTEKLFRFSIRRLLGRLVARLLAGAVT
jgi:hypothetical protein